MCEAQGKLGLCACRSWNLAEDGRNKLKKKQKNIFMTSGRNCQAFFPGFRMENNKVTGSPHFRLSGKTSLNRWHLKKQTKNEEQESKRKLQEKKGWSCSRNVQDMRVQEKINSTSWIVKTQHIPKPVWPVTSSWEITGTYELLATLS